MATYIELGFRAVGELAHRDAVERIEAISAVDVLLDHTRACGWLERQRLLVDEWDCVIVVAVYEPAEMRDRNRTGFEDGDPYRTIVFDGPKREVPAALADLADELGARCVLVTSGWLRFETRVYEAELLAGLETELRELAGDGARCQLVRSPGLLRGRIQGHIPVIDELHQGLKRSGMVAHDRILVGYD